MGEETRSRFKKVDMDCFVFQQNGTTEEELERVHDELYYQPCDRCAIFVNLAYSIGMNMASVDIFLNDDYHRRRLTCLAMYKVVHKSEVWNAAGTALRFIEANISPEGDFDSENCFLALEGAGFIDF